MRGTRDSRARWPTLGVLFLGLAAVLIIMARLAVLSPDAATNSSERPDASAGQGEDGALASSPWSAGIGEERLLSDVPDVLVETFPQAVQLIGEGTSSYQVEGNVADVAVSVLTDYEREDACVLTWEGYLDLTGNVWASLVQGDGWVEMKVVSQSTETHSQVTTVRMDAEAWEGELSDMGVGRDDA